MEIDKITLTRISKLHPKIKDELPKIIADIHAIGLNIRITQGLRTFKEQDDLYAQGRTKPGSIVTNAKGGESFHNYGLAVDFCLLHSNGTVSFDLNEDENHNVTKDWMEVVKSFKKFGWTWGGDFKKFKDNPHFEKTFGNSLSAIKKLKLDSNGYVII